MGHEPICILAFSISIMSIAVSLVSMVFVMGHIQKQKGDYFPPVDEIKKPEM